MMAISNIPADNMIKFPKIMGILNVTPDSFSDGGRFFNHDTAISHGLRLLDEGADILDIGGESSRPGAVGISVDEEIDRVLPVIKRIKSEKPDSIISIDTTKYEVALEATLSGASIINDISGLDNDIRLANLAAEKNISLVLMHMQGSPVSMQINPSYNEVVSDVYRSLESKVNTARSLGVNKIIIDVGIGFGKTYEQNIELLRHQSQFKKLGTELLLGISRKSFIGKMLGIDAPSERDLPTLAIHAILLNHGIDIIRVHNVANISMLRTIYNHIII
jgi:dihydropteroate synthase